MNTTQRVLGRLKRSGWTAGCVERYGYGKGIHAKRDLFGIVDIVAVRPDWQGTLYIQATGREALDRHVKKMLASESTPVIVAGNRLEIWSFGQFKPLGAAPSFIRLVLSIGNGRPKVHCHHCYTKPIPELIKPPSDHIETRIWNLPSS